MPIYKINGKLLLFIHVPRTAGTTVAHCLSGVGTEFFKSSGRTSLLRVTAQHLHGRDLEAIFPQSLFDYAFMFVRHPVTRMVSQYSFEVSRGLKAARLPFSLWLHYSIWRTRQKPYYRDNHFCPQSEFQCFDAEVFKIEDGVEKVFERIESKFPVVLPRQVAPLNNSERDAFEISKKDIAFIREHYAQDFERFNYDADQFDLASVHAPSSGDRTT